jgi:hypothetical protein
MLEILQVLKHLFKQERLDFASHWIANGDYSIEKVTEAAIHELVSAREIELLDLELNNNAHKSSRILV